MEEDLKEIEATVLKVLRLAYLRPALKGTDMKPFEMTEEEISAVLEGEGSEGLMSADMDMLSECLKAAYELGSAQGHSPQVLDDEIVIEGNAS